VSQTATSAASRARGITTRGPSRRSNAKREACLLEQMSRPSTARRPRRRAARTSGVGRRRRRGRRRGSFGVSPIASAASSSRQAERGAVTTRRSCRGAPAAKRRRVARSEAQSVSFAASERARETLRLRSRDLAYAFAAKRPDDRAPDRPAPRTRAVLPPRGSPRPQLLPGPFRRRCCADQLSTLTHDRIDGADRRAAATVGRASEGSFLCAVR